MDDKIKEAFDQVHAENILKDKTKEFILKKTHGYKQAWTLNYRHLVSAFACIVLLLIGGQWLYFTPTVEISIDINPSIELSVNRFNRIISFESYNDDGKKLINSLDIKFMKYTEAVNQIIESEDIVSLLSNDEILMLVIIGSDSKQSEEILSNIQSYTWERNNTYCYYANSEEVETAHEVGLSYGKYRAYLELQRFDSTITVDDIQNMTMREIRDRINELSNNEESKTNPMENGEGNQGNKNGQGQKNRRRNKKTSYNDYPQLFI